MSIFILIVCFLVVAPVLYLLAPSDVQLGRTYGSEPASDVLAQYRQKDFKALGYASHEEMMASVKKVIDRMNCVNRPL